MNNYTYIKIIMMNPFEDNDIEKQRDTDKFIEHPSIYISVPPKKNNKKNCISYIIIGFIYLLEILTSILGGLNDSYTIGLNYSKFTIQYWLMIFAIYNIFGMMLIYQFNQRTYINKIYFIFYEFIKIIWLIIGFIILFKYNSNDFNFICGYALFYGLFQIIWIIFNLAYTCKLKKYN